MCSRGLDAGHAFSTVLCHVRLKRVSLTGICFSKLLAQEQEAAARPFCEPLGKFGISPGQSTALLAPDAVGSLGSVASGEGTAHLF